MHANASYIYEEDVTAYKNTEYITTWYRDIELWYQDV